jgi:hypothetical protein
MVPLPPVLALSVPDKFTVRARYPVEICRDGRFLALGV